MPVLQHDMRYGTSDSGAFYFEILIVYAIFPLSCVWLSAVWNSSLIVNHMRLIFWLLLFSCFCFFRFHSVDGSTHKSSCQKGHLGYLKTGNTKPINLSFIFFRRPLIAQRRLLLMLVSTPLRIVNRCCSGFPVSATKWRYINVRIFYL